MVRCARGQGKGHGVRKACEIAGHYMEGSFPKRTGQGPWGTRRSPLFTLWVTPWGFMHKRVGRWKGAEGSVPKGHKTTCEIIVVAPPLSVFSVKARRTTSGLVIEPTIPHR